jgi:hypothetical protein
VSACVIRCSSQDAGAHGNVDPVEHPDAVVAVPPGQPPRAKHMRIDVPGGWISITPTNIDAHCSDPRHESANGHGCSTNSTRTPKNSETSIEGRRAAWLMAWLAYGQHCTTRDAHKAAVSRKKSDRPPEARAAMSLAIREDWRKWLNVNRPAIVQEERPKRSSEPDEQPDL